MIRFPAVNYPAVNRYFTMACFATPPILGSVVTFLWHGGAIWCAVQIVLRRQRISTDRYFHAMAACAWLYATWSLLCALYNGIAIDQAAYLLPLATFVLFPFSYSLWTISDKSEVMRASILASMAACYGACALALVQFYLLDLRAEGAAGNALVFATVTCLAGSVSLAGAFTLERRLAGPLGGAFFASVLAIMHSESRIFWLVALVTMVLVLWVYRKQLRTMPRRRVMAVAGVFVLVLAGLSFELVRPRVQLLLDNWNTFAADADYDSSLGVRLALWQIGIDLFRDSPVFGYGMQSTVEILHNSLQERFGVTRSYTHFHNGVITLLVESGIVGAGAILAFLAVMAVNAIRTLRDSTDPTRVFGATMLASVIVVYVLGGMTNLMIGHDILDTMLMIFAIVGTYLASGTSMLANPTAEDTGATSSPA